MYLKNLNIDPLPDIPPQVLQLAGGQSRSIVYIKVVKAKLDDVPASRYQIPLMPAYALTVHKAQGLSLDKCIVDTVTKQVGHQRHIIQFTLHFRA